MPRSNALCSLGANEVARTTIPLHEVSERRFHLWAAVASTLRRSCRASDCDGTNASPATAPTTARTCPARSRLARAACGDERDAAGAHVVRLAVDDEACGAAHDDVEILWTGRAALGVVLDDAVAELHAEEGVGAER